VRAPKEGYLKIPATSKIKKNDCLVKVRDLINLPVLQPPLLLRSYYPLSTKMVSLRIIVP
jgi:hypothetical protein